MKTTNDNKNSKKRKFLLLGIGMGVLALGGFGYWYFKGRKGVTIENPEDDILHQLTNEVPASKVIPKIKANTPKTNPPIPKTNASLSPVMEKNFPLQKGSKNDLVKKLQQALMKTYGKKILPKYADDGQFGNEVITALKSKGFPSVVDEILFNKIVGVSAPVPAQGITDSERENIEITKNIWLYSTTKKLNALVDTLKKIKSVAQYIKVNELFKTIRLNGVRQTIVNAALSTFSDDTSKQFIKNEFIRIGLKYDGEKWSLSGVNEKQIFSKQDTTICCPDGSSLRVPKNTLLGIQVARGKFNTRFRSFNNQTLFVPTKHISYVE